MRIIQHCQDQQHYYENRDGVGMFERFTFLGYHVQERLAIGRTRRYIHAFFVVIGIALKAAAWLNRRQIVRRLLPDQFRIAVCDKAAILIIDSCNDMSLLNRKTVDRVFIGHPIKLRVQIFGTEDSQKKSVRLILLVFHQDSCTKLHLSCVRIRFGTHDCIGISQKNCTVLITEILTDSKACVTVAGEKLLSGLVEKHQVITAGNAVELAQIFLCL